MDNTNEDLYMLGNLIEEFVGRVVVMSSVVKHRVAMRLPMHFLPPEVFAE